MVDFMDYSKNLRYFKGSDTHFYVGIVLLAIGVIMIVLSYFFWVYLVPYQDFAAIALVIIGACIAWIPQYRRSGEKDIDAYVSVRAEGYAKEITERFHLSSNAKAKIESVLTGSFLLDADTKGWVYRRGKNDRKYRSSLYAITALFFTEVGILAATKRISLTEDSESETIKEIRLYDIEDIKIDYEEKLVEKDKVKAYHLIIRANGETVLDVPVAPNAQLDAKCEEIRAQMIKIKA